MASSYQVTKISDTHYRISESNVFMELLVGTEKAMLIDTGFGFGDLNRTIRSITALPLVVVNTHGHPDHSCGNWQFAEPVWINRKDLAPCEMYNTPEARAAACPNPVPDDFLEAGYRKGGSGDLHFTEEGQVFDLGGLRLEVVDLPGHTAGSIGLLNRAERSLFVGDAMNTALFLFQKDVSQPISTYLRTLDKAAALPVDTLWLAHVPEAQPKEASIAVYRRCAETVDFDAAFPCGEMLGTPEVRLHIMPEMRGQVDPADPVRSVYVSGLVRQPGFASIFIAKDQLG